MPKADIAILLALGAALVSALGSVIRQRSAHEIINKPVGAWELFRLSLRDTRWWLGGAAAVANYAFQAGALSLGSVMLVTGLQVTALLFAFPIYARMTGHSSDPLGLVLGSGPGRRAGGRRPFGDPTAGYAAGPVVDLGVVGVVMGPPLVLCVLGARIWSGAVGGAAGGGLGCVTGTVRGADQGRRQGGRRWRWGLARAPELYAWLAVALAGMVFQQAAFRGGPLTASMPTMTVAKPAWDRCWVSPCWGAAASTAGCFLSWRSSSWWSRPWHSPGRGRGRAGLCGDVETPAIAGTVGPLV